MNWYKIALADNRQIKPIEIISYNRYWELGVSFNGSKAYIYKDISPFTYNKIQSLLRYKNYKEVNRLLQIISEKNRKEETGLTREQERILDELEREGLISPKKKI